MKAVRPSTTGRGSGTVQTRHCSGASHQSHLSAHLEGHLNRQRQLTAGARLQARQIKLGLARRQD